MAENHILIDQETEVPYDFTATSSSDKAQLQTEYTDAFDGWKSRCPKFGSAHPEDNIFYLVSIKASREPGNLVRVKLGYESFAASASYQPGGGTIKRYAVEPALETVSILASDFAKDLSTAEKTALNQILNGTETKDDGSSWADDVASETGLAVLGKIRAGTTSVEIANFHWVETFISANLSDFDLGDTNKIDTPAGPVPTMPAGYTWRRVASPVRQTADGLAWEGDRRWQLSGPKGWDTDLYDTE